MREEETRSCITVKNKKVYAVKIIFLTKTTAICGHDMQQVKPLFVQVSECLYVDEYVSSVKLGVGGSVSRETPSSEMFVDDVDETRPHENTHRKVN